MHRRKRRNCGFDLFWSHEPRVHWRHNSRWSDRVDSNLVTGKLDGGWGTNLRGDLECFNTALEDRKLEAYATHVGHASSLPAITPTACCGF